VKITDEILCAYIDGELTAEDRFAVERASEESLEVSQRIEEIKNIDDLFAENCRVIDNTPIPEKILSTLQAFTKEPSIDNVERVKTIPPTNDNMPAAQQKRFWHIAAAASILLIIGAGIGRNMSISVPNAEQAQEFIFAQQTVGVIGPENVLFDILEKEPSGSSVTINQSNGTIVRPIMTFQNGENNYCREFNIATPTEGTNNIACREGDNVWAIRVTVKASGPSLLVDGLYQTATMDGEPIIDAMVRHMIKGDALGLETETLLIKQKWSQD
tara:strand:+ start:1030 stop:1845 length:816 start_codon:yes stop_codon:yes gene_type:complete